MRPTLMGALVCAWPAAASKANAAAAVSLSAVFIGCSSSWMSWCGVAPDERAGRLDQLVGLVAMRRMAAVCQHEQFRPRHAARDAADLLERAVLVAFALHGEQRAVDAVERRLDVPG